MISLILKQVLTEDDANSVYCPIRLLATFVVLTYISLSIFSTIHTGTFDMQSFGIGAGAVIAAAGAAIGMKAKLGG